MCVERVCGTTSTSVWFYIHSAFVPDVYAISVDVQRDHLHSATRTLLVAMNSVIVVVRICCRGIFVLVLAHQIVTFIYWLAVAPVSPATPRTLCRPITALCALRKVLLRMRMQLFAYFFQCMHWSHCEQVFIHSIYELCWFLHPNFFGQFKFGEYFWLLASVLCCRLKQLSRSESFIE